MTGQAPATRAAVAAYLDSLGVRPDCYHLSGAHVDDAMVLDHRPEGWVVFYSERGGEWSPQVFDSEAAACRELVARVTAEDHNFFELVAGPAPVEEADAAWVAWLNARRIGVEQLGHRDWKSDDVPWVPGAYWRRYFVRVSVARSHPVASG